MKLLEVKNLKKYFETREGLLNRMVGRGPLIFKAVDGISFTIDQQETMALVGESGCGKTTTGRLVLRLLEATAGEIFYLGQAVQDFSAKELKKFREQAQIILQDPRSSLNPRLIVEEIISEPLYIHNRVTDDLNLLDRVWELLDMVDLSRRYSEVFPHELSGGEARRIGIARALALNPDFIVCDEPTAGLDISIRSDILNLMQDLQQQYSLTYLWISHDLNVVRYISNKVAVMYLGKIVEQAETEEIFAEPLHPYTKALFSSLRTAGDSQSYQEQEVLEGEVPSSINPPSGCSFHPRCKYSFAKCPKIETELKQEGTPHPVSCHLYH